MNRIKWCLRLKNGIKLVDLNNTISDDYMTQSLDDFSMISKSNEKWKRVISYYSCYNALYSILIRIGIKCEVHDCIIALMSILGFLENDILFLNVLKEERINVQYYLKRSNVLINENEVFDFIIKCKEIVTNLNDDRIFEIRKKIDSMIKK